MAIISGIIPLDNAIVDLPTNVDKQLELLLIKHHLLKKYVTSLELQKISEMM